MTAAYRRAGRGGMLIAVGVALAGAFAGAGVVTAQPLRLPGGVAAQAVRETAAPVPIPITAPIATSADATDGFVLDGAVRQGGLLYGTAPAGTRGLTLDGVPLAMAADRHFLVGLDRDAAPVVQLVATRDDGGQVVRTLSVRPGEWQVQSLPTLPKATPRTAEAIARRDAELAQIAAARAVVNVGDGWRQRPLWPAAGRISGVFGSQRVYAGEPGAYHGGVDIARLTGTPVASPLDGVVVLAAAVPFSLEGRLLLIDHGMGLGSAFLHLLRIDVQVGDRVTRGQPVGAVGATGRATGPHLHWAMTWNGRRIDPQPLAGAMATVGPSRSR